MPYIAFEHRINYSDKVEAAIFSKAVGGEYIHCEIHFPQFGYDRASSWFPKGIQIREFGDFLNHAQNWEIYDLGDMGESRLYEYFKSRVGDRYSTGSLIFNMILNLDVDFNKRNFCSQVCYEGITQVLALPLPTVRANTISPTELYYMILGLGLRKVSYT